MRSPTPSSWLRRVAGVAALAVVAAGLAAAPATATPNDRPDLLTPGQSLTAAEDLVSLDGSHRLTMRPNGSAAVVSSTGTVQWQTTTAGTGAKLTLRTDGKTVLYTAADVGKWWSPPAATNAELFVLNSGQLATFVNEQPVWWTVPGATGTGQTVTTGTGPAYPVEPRVAVDHPFSSTSPWNTAIGSGAVFEPATGPIRSSLITSKPGLNHEQWSIAVYQAKTTDPFSTVRSIRNSVTHTAYVPTNTVPTAGDDRHVTVLQPDGRYYLDTFKWDGWTGTRWDAQLASKLDLHGTGISQGHRAARVPAIAGLIRAHELEQGHIPHALALAAPNTVLKSGYVWPAAGQDGDGTTSYSGGVPMGTLFAIPGSVDVTSLGLSPEGLTLARALQDYGAYMVDRAGSNNLYCELDCNLAQANATRDAWKILHPYLRTVTNNTPTTVGGGGTPRVAPATPLS